MKPVWVVTAALGLALAPAVTTSARGQEGQELKFSDCPAAVQKTLREESKGATIAVVSRETEDDRTTYRARAVIDGVRYEIAVNEDGALAGLNLDVGEIEVKFADCPAAVQATFRRESNQAKLDVVNKDLRYGGTVYEAVVTVGGKDYDLIVAEDGTLLEKVLVIEEDEVELSDCPAAVQKTLKEHARGGEVGPVTRATGIGGHVFEAGVEVRGKTYILEVTERGVLVSKTLEESDDE